MALTQVPAAQTGGMTLLSTTSLSGTSTTISGISGSYNNLAAVIYGVQLNSGSDLRINPNSNSGYARAMVYGNAGTTPITSTNIQTRSPATTAYPAEFAFYFSLTNYASTASAKPFEFYGNSDSGDYQSVEFGIWNRTNAVTSLVFTTSNGTSTFSAGTVLLYGVK